MSAWVAEKHSVTFTRMPSLLNAAHAMMPSRVSGHFTTMFLWILDRLWPSRIIEEASVATTSALMSPSTMSQMRRTCSSIGRPSLAMRDGLVVTPSRIPQLAPFLISSRFAVSRKNFTCSALRITLSLASPGSPERGLPDRPDRGPLTPGFDRPA